MAFQFLLEIRGIQHETYGGLKDFRHEDATMQHWHVKILWYIFFSSQWTLPIIKSLSYHSPRSYWKFHVFLLAPCCLSTSASDHLDFLQSAMPAPWGPYVPIKAEIGWVSVCSPQDKSPATARRLFRRSSSECEKWRPIITSYGFLWFHIWIYIYMSIFSVYIWPIYNISLVVQI